jgi:hypothetical protein
MWHDQVQRYTELDLTFPKDMLPAIAGVAEQLQEDGSKYHAGLREEFLPEDLLWFVNFPRPRGTERLAPSWSWAVDTNKKSFASIAKDIVADDFSVQSIVCTNSKTDQFIRCLEDYIVLSGRMVAVHLRRYTYEISSVSGEFSYFYLHTPKGNFGRMVWLDYLPTENDDGWRTCSDTTHTPDSGAKILRVFERVDLIHCLLIGGLG